MKLIPISRGHFMKVDDEDAHHFEKHRWQYSQGYAAFDWYQPNQNGRRVRKTILAHRVIMDAQPGQEVDHINGDRLDNRRANLRFVTHSQNMCNTPLRRDNSTGYRGVYSHANPGRFTARIVVDNKNTYLGYFSDKESAARAYDEAARRHFGEFARPNFSEAA